MKIPERVVFIEDILSKPKHVGGGKYKVNVQVNRDYKLEFSVVTSPSLESANSLKVGQSVNSKFGGYLLF